MSSLGRVPVPCGHSEYENMESDVPDASTDDEGLSNLRRDSAGSKAASGDRRPEERKETPLQNPPMEKHSHKGTEHQTDDDDDVRSFEEEERRMAHELSAAHMDRSGNTSGQSLPVVSEIVVEATHIMFSPYRCKVVRFAIHGRSKKGQVVLQPFLESSANISITIQICS